MENILAIAGRTRFEDRPAFFRRIDPRAKPVDGRVQAERLLAAAHRHWPGPEPRRFVLVYMAAISEGFPQFIDSWHPQEFDAPAKIEPKRPPIKPRKWQIN